MGRLKGLAKNTISLASGNVAVNLIGLIQNILIVKFMGASVVGLLGIVAAYAVIVNSISGFRTSDCLTKYLVEYRLKNKIPELRHVVYLSISLDVVSRILAVVIFAVTAKILEKSMINDSRAFVIFGFTAVVSAATCLDAVWFSLMRDASRYKGIAATNLLLAILKTASIAILGTIDMLGINSFAAVTIAIGLLRAVVVAVELRGILKGRFDISLKSGDFFNALRRYKEDIGFWMYMKSGWFSTIVTNLVKNGDVLILGYFISNAEVGVYKTARTIASVIQGAFSNFPQVAYQEINLLISGGQVSEVKRMLVRTMMAIFIVGVAFWVLGYFSAPWIIDILYGPEFAGVSFLLNILLLGLLFSFCLYWVPALGLSLGFGPSIYRNTSIIGIASIILMAVAGKGFGSAGVSAVLALTWTMSAGILLLTVPIIQALNSPLRSGS